MKYFVFYFILFSIYCIATVLASTSVRFYKDPDFPEHCVLKEFDLILSPGAKYQEPNWCGVIVCHEKSLVSRHSCNEYTATDGCEVMKPLDPDGDYPACCPQGIVCNEAK